MVEKGVGMDKLLVMVYVPMIEETFDMYIPTVKKVGAVKKLILKIIEENTEGLFVDDGCKYLYDKVTGNLISDEAFVKTSGIKNGSKLILN